MTNAVREIQVSIEEARETVALNDALERLNQNADFRKVILDDYFKDNAIRLVELKAAPQAQAEQVQANIMRDIDAIGALKQHFNMLRVMAEQAKASIDDSQETLNDMAEEGEM